MALSLQAALCCFLLPIIFPLTCPLRIASQTIDSLHRSTNFTFNHFINASDLIRQNHASILSNAIRLTDNSQQIFGRALYPTPLKMKTNNNTLISFSTTFVFSMVPPPSEPSLGDGLAFVVTPYTSPMGAFPAQYLGLFNVSSNGQPYNHLFAVEFQDIDNNHVGVDLNSLTSSASRTAGYWIGKQFHPLRLKSGQNIQAWIDYDHLQNQLNVTITLAGSPKPVQPLLSVKNKNLSSILREEMYVGFSAATGIGEDQYILAFSHLPSFINKEPPRRLSKGFIAGINIVSLVLLSVAIYSVYRWLKRMKHREIIEDWEHEFWPHRFTHRELSIATNGFREEQLLGSGGFVGRRIIGLLTKPNFMTITSVTRT